MMRVLLAMGSKLQPCFQYHSYMSLPLATKLFTRYKCLPRLETRRRKVIYHCSQLSHQSRGPLCHACTRCMWTRIKKCHDCTAPVIRFYSFYGLCNRLRLSCRHYRVVKLICAWYGFLHILKWGLRLIRECSCSVQCARCRTLGSSLMKSCQ